MQTKPTHDPHAALVADIVVATLQHMADCTGLTLAQTADAVLITRAPNAVRVFNHYMGVASDYATGRAVW